MDYLTSILGAGWLATAVLLIGHILKYRTDSQGVNLALRRMEEEFLQHDTDEARKARDEERQWRREQVEELRNRIRELEEQLAGVDDRKHNRAAAAAAAEKP